MTQEDTTSPTVMAKGIFITGVIDAKEERDNMSADIPNAFIQTTIPRDKDPHKRIIMKITGKLVDLLVQKAPEVNAKCVVYKNGKKVLYVEVLRALYGMLVSAMLWYNKFRSNLEGVGFIFNPYDPCVANRIIKGKQQTICFHVDNLMSSHIDRRVNDQFLEWLEEKYGKHGEVKSTRGELHEFLGMTLDFRTKGKIRADMSKYMSKMYKDFESKYTLNNTNL